MAELRGSRSYEKDALSVDELLQRWLDRGLIVADPERAKRYLRHIGYYRLSPYGIPFRLPQDDGRGTADDFRPGASFDDLLELYIFDRQLRGIVFDAIERVEVAVRAALTDHMATSTGDPFWYADARHFADTSKHATLLKFVRDECQKELKRARGETYSQLNHMSALRHYLTQYADPELPPSWVTVEILTLGQIEVTFANLKRRADKTAVAETLGINAPLLESWLGTFVRVRNICGHHGRLWNAWLGRYPKQPQSADVPWLQRRDGYPTNWTKKLYPALAALQVILFTISPHSGWATRLHGHVASGRAPLGAMGMPAGWGSDPFWQRALGSSGAAEHPETLV